MAIAGTRYEKEKIIHTSYQGDVYTLTIPEKNGNFIKHVPLYSYKLELAGCCVYVTKEPLDRVKFSICFEILSDQNLGVAGEDDTIYADTSFEAKAYLDMLVKDSTTSYFTAAGYLTYYDPIVSKDRKAWIGTWIKYDDGKIYFSDANTGSAEAGTTVLTIAHLNLAKNIIYFEHGSPSTSCKPIAMSMNIIKTRIR